MHGAGVNTAVGCKASDAPAGALKYTDGAYISSAFFANEFPYLRAPLKGSPNDDNAIKAKRRREVARRYDAAPGRCSGAVSFGDAEMRRTAMRARYGLRSSRARWSRAAHSRRCPPSAAPYVPATTTQVLERAARARGARSRAS